MIDPDDGNRRRVGLCFDCRSAQKLTSAKGSSFYRCVRARSDPAFRDYPPLPVRACSGFEVVEAPDEPREE